MKNDGLWEHCSLFLKPHGGGDDKLWINLPGLTVINNLLIVLSYSWYTYQQTCKKQEKADLCIQSSYWGYCYCKLLVRKLIMIIIYYLYILYIFVFWRIILEIWWRGFRAWWQECHPSSHCYQATAVHFHSQTRSG